MGELKPGRRLAVLHLPADAVLQVLGVEAIKDGVLHFPRLNLVPGTKAASVAHRPETGLL